MDVITRQKDSIVILDLIGELDLYHSDQLRDLLRQTIDSGRTQIILNCKELTYLDSSGLGAMIWNLQYVKTKKGFIRLVHLGGSPKSVMELSNAIRLFSVFNSEEDAARL